LPPALANFASSLIAAAHVNDSKKEVSPNTLILIISEEYECHAAHCSNHGKTGKSEANGQDEALAVTSGKGKKPKRDNSCWNCGKKGHYKDKCPKPPKARSGDPKQKGGSANAAVESDSESEAAFHIDSGYDSDEDLMPDLHTVSDSSEEADVMSDGDDWFLEVDESDVGKIESVERSEELSGVDWSKTSPFVSIDTDSEDAQDVVALVSASNNAEDSPHAEVYDSGTTRYLSLFHEDLENFTNITRSLLSPTNSWWNPQESSGIPGIPGMNQE
jgi:hypothetical protein